MNLPDLSQHRLRALFVAAGQACAWRVAAVAPLVLADVVVPEAGGAMLLVAGIEVVSDRAVRDYTFQWTEGDRPAPFAILAQPPAVVLSERFAQRYGFR